MHADGYTVAVIEQGPRLLGYALGRRSHQETLPSYAQLDQRLPAGWLATCWWLLWIGVDPTAQRRQVGMELLGLVLGGVSHAALYVDDDSEGAKAFYRACGWWPAGSAGSQQLWIVDRRQGGQRSLRPASSPLQAVPSGSTGDRAEGGKA